jgi:hypothetical protein
MIAVQAPAEPAVEDVRDALLAAEFAESARKPGPRPGTWVWEISRAGFAVYTSAGSTRVAFRETDDPADPASALSGTELLDKENRILGQYAEALNAAGWRVETASFGYLVIRSRADKPAPEA